MAYKFSSSQYNLLSRYTEDLSKAIMLYNTVGYFLPSILPSATKPSLLQLVIGVTVALTLLLISFILIKRGGRR